MNAKEVHLKMDAKEKEAEADRRAPDDHDRDRVCLTWSYLLTRVVIVVSNLCSAIFKLPFIVSIIQLVFDLVRVGKEAKAAAPSVDPEPESEGGAAVGVSTGVKAEVGFLFVLYVAVILVHLYTSFASCRNRSSFHLFLYFPFLGIWITFSCLAYFSDSWGQPFNMVIVVLKFFIGGVHALAPPSNWEIILLRVAIVVDVITYPLVILFAILSCRLKVYEKRHSCLCFRPHYNLVSAL